MPHREIPVVYLVGAGPGDPGYITLRGVECLRRADVVLYDYLANPAMLSHVQPHCEKVCLGKHGGSRIWSQDEINAEIVRLAKAGKTVVRLKGGDPAVFARGAEEVETLVQHNIRFEIVPGITTALAAGSCAGVPITHRDLASAVALVTGQERAGKEQSAIDYQSLANFPGTLVFYMGVTTIDQWTQGLLAAGKSADTPTVVVRRCSFANQQTTFCNLGELAETVRNNRIRPPSIVIIGEVARLGPKMSWFDKRPLFGQRILVTRPQHQAAGLATPLAELGADVLEQPGIEISDPPDWAPVDDALARLGEFDWLVFSSANGVRRTLNRLMAIGWDMRALGAAKLAAIGPATAEALAEFHLKADLVPQRFIADALAEALCDGNGMNYLLLRASRGRDLLATELRAVGRNVEEIVVYESRDVTQPDEAIAAQLANGEIDWVTVTSSAIASSLVNMFGENLRQTKIASISPQTTSRLKEFGLSPTVEASEYHMPGLTEAILDAVQTGS